MRLFQFPTPTSPIPSAKYEPATNNFILRKFQKKTFFIQNFLNSIITKQFNATSFDALSQLYEKKTEEYKQDICNLLKTLPRNKQKCLLSVDEIVEMINTSHIHIQPSSDTIKKFNDTKFRFYSEDSELQTYIKAYYP